VDVRASLFVFAIDLVDEGLATVLDRIGGRAGADTITLAAAYHHARDVLPHNPNRAVYYHEGGTVFFHPSEDAYGSLVPRRASLARERDRLDELCSAAGRRGLDVQAWVVYLHNSRLATLVPDCATVNVFGDRSHTDLCPSHPEVVRYVTALTQDVCRYPITAIVAESLHFKPFDHGYHHERMFVDLGAVAKFLLGLCFCEWCERRALDRGVAVDDLRHTVSGFLRGVFDEGRGGFGGLRMADMVDAVGPGITGYCAARADSVADLVGRVSDIARGAGVELTFSAHAGSAKGGSTRSTDSADEAWALGLDLGRVAEITDVFHVLGYVETGVELGQMIEEYRAELGGTAFAVGLRPMWPDTSGPEDLAAKVRVAREAGARRIDFYHYGLMPERSLDWIRGALQR
jgi:hypothetical protein